MPLVARLRLLVARFVADRRGNVAVVAGFALLPMIAGAGLSVDVVLAYSTEDALQKSLDAAGLAAGRAVDPADARKDAEAFLRSNFATGSGGASITAFDLKPGDTRDEYVLTASARMPTHFMRVFSIDDVTVQASTTIHKKVHQMELALVLDNTGSMAGSPFTAMQQAAKDLVGIVYGAEDEHPNLWVSVVPWVTSVNIGNQRLSWLEVDDPARKAKFNPFHPSSWKGCVMARPSPYDETDDPPSAKSFKSFFYPDFEDNDWTPKYRADAPLPENVDPSVTDWRGKLMSPATKETLAAGNDAYGPNLSCGSPILPLTAKKSKVLAALDGMGAWSRGGTLGNQGFVWGWATISPRWRGLWGGDTPATSPLDYETGKTDKVVVFLTDGNNEIYDKDNTPNTKSDFTPYGRINDFGYSTRPAAVKFMNDKEARICAAMKREGIVIYTISFGSAPNGDAKTLLTSCATKAANYFHAPDNATLKTIFKAIGQQLSELRIVR